jgi:hypothetical protein
MAPATCTSCWIEAKSLHGTSQRNLNKYGKPIDISYFWSINILNKFINSKDNIHQGCAIRLFAYSPIRIYSPILIFVYSFFAIRHFLKYSFIRFSPFVIFWYVRLFVIRHSLFENGFGTPLIYTHIVKIFEEKIVKIILLGNMI